MSELGAVGLVSNGRPSERPRDSHRANFQNLCKFAKILEICKGCLAGPQAVAKCFNPSTLFAAPRESTAPAALKK